jgi:hypothetical protein
MLSEFFFLIMHNLSFITFYFYFLLITERLIQLYSRIFIFESQGTCYQKISGVNYYKAVDFAANTKTPVKKVYML